jgi:heat shock protein HslJ
MNRFGRTAGSRRMAALVGAASLFALTAAGYCEAATTEFPFDRILMLDAAPMRPAKRKPSLTVATNGSVTIDLWCKSVEGRVEIADTAIKIVAAPLPEAMPDMMANGQCTPERMRADAGLLNALSQVDAWRRQGSAVMLSGPTTLRFYPSTN